MNPVLAIERLSVVYTRRGARIGALDDFSLAVMPGEAVALVGESGSGKSTAMLAAMNLLPPNSRCTARRISFDGRDLLAMSDGERRARYGRDLAMIFQDPMTSLNPTMTIGRQIAEPLLWHKLADKRRARLRAAELLRRVGIPDSERRLNEYPFQFSGGMRQRVMIAMSLVCGPRLLIADEPTTSVDVTVQSQILNLLRELRAEQNLSVVLITHDLAVAAEFCERIVGLYAGRMVESGRVGDVLRNPVHPYMEGLLRATPEIGTGRTGIIPIRGSPVDMRTPPPGCRFHPRCPLAVARCRVEQPPFVSISPDRQLACWVRGERSNTLP